MPKYLLEMMDGFAESSSNAFVRASIETTKKITPLELVRLFIKDWTEFFKEQHKENTCCPSKGNYCPECGKKIGVKVDTNEVAAEYFRNEYLGGQVDGFGLYFNDDLVEFMGERGWNLWGEHNGKYTVVDCCYLSDLISGERELEDWMVSSYSCSRKKNA